MRKISILFVMALFAIAANAQQPTSFTYQGKLNSSSLPATGVYDFIFIVSDVATGTGAVDSTISVSGVQVTNGVFTANLDFPATVWTTNPGPRFLTIKVKAAADSTYVELTPRQPIGATPFATRAAVADTATTADSSNTLGGLTPDGFVQLDPTVEQVGGFSIRNGTLSGTLNAGTVNATTDFRLNSQRYLSSPGGSNFFAGILAGSSAVSGVRNTAIGNAGGGNLSSGSNNSLLGDGAGLGIGAGWHNTVIGASAGTGITDGYGNSLVGSQAGLETSGSENTFMGFTAGSRNGGGSSNTFIGAFSNTQSPQLTNAGAFGYRAMVSTDNSIVLGSISGVNGALADTNVGIGTSAPLTRLDVRGNVFVGLEDLPNVPANFLADRRALYLGNFAGNGGTSFRIGGVANNLNIVARSADGSTAGVGIIFSTAPAGQGEIERMSIAPTGELRLNTLGTGGSTPLCRNSNNEIATCGGPLADPQKQIDEQTTIIDAQKNRIEQLEKQVDALKAAVCGINPSAAVCVQTTEKKQRS